MSGTADQVAIDGTPTNGTNPWIDSLVWGGAWADSSGLATSGGPVTISWFAATGYDDYTGYEGAEWFASELLAVQEALSSWESVASIDFIESGQDNADVWFWNTVLMSSEGSYGYSEVPDGSASEPLYTVFAWDDPSWAELQLGGYGFVTLIHEFGHLLGLAHPHDGGSLDYGNNFPGVSEPFDDYGNHDLNQGIFTTMSYNSGWVTQFPDHSDLSYGYEATPMAFDIAAIQAIYGANTTYASGENTYQMPKANASGTYWSCIWDTGGTDLVTNEGSSIACTIDLRAATLQGENGGGYVSFASGIVGGFTIANGVVVENATGGSGNDVITGNSSANTLGGGTGTDTLIGGAGNDTYVTDGGDTITEDASAGTDSVQSSATAILGLNLENLTLTGSGANNGTGNTLNNIITGNSAANTINGGTGNDTLDGGAGKDTIIGGEGNDTASYASASAAVTVSLAITKTQNTKGAGTDTLSTIESLTGSSFNDVLTGSSSANSISGSAGNDVINGGGGIDTLDGGEGSDIYLVTLLADKTAAEISDTGTTGTDELRFAATTAGTLTLLAGDTGLERVVIGTGTGASAATTGKVALNVDATLSANGLTITGNAGNNTLTGSGFADALNGGAGNDVLLGGLGNDVLIGGSGQDTLTGGSESDTFKFNFITESGTSATKSDVITYFVQGEDKIDLSAIDAFAATRSVNDAFIWRGTAAFSNTTQGEVCYQTFDATGTANDHTMIWIDNDKDKGVEMAICLTGLYDLRASDFVL